MRIWLGLAASIPLTSLPVLAAEVYPLNEGHTFAYFEVNHLGFSTYRGRFDKTKGAVTLDVANKKGSVDVTIDANSVSTGVPALDDHLRKPDFLEVKTYPTIKFKSTELKFDNDELVAVTGNLTLHGVTKPVTLEVTSFNCGKHPMTQKPACGADAQTTIKRSDFGIKYGIPNVGDAVTIRIQAEGYQ